MHLVPSILSLIRSKAKVLVNHLIERTRSPCINCLKDAGISTEEVDEVLFVGGMTRVPKVWDIIAEIFGKTPSKVVNPDEAVAMGAEIQDGLLHGAVEDLLLLPVTTLSLGSETLDCIFTRLISRNATIPTKKYQLQIIRLKLGLKCFRGWCQIAADDKLLGEFNLEGIPPAPRDCHKLK